jgi:hypothetical protein
VWVYLASLKEAPMPRLPISRTKVRSPIPQLGVIQISKPPRSYGITTCVNHNCRFNKINRTRRRLIASDIARAKDIAPGSSRKIAAMAGYRNHFGSPRSP